MGDPEVTEELTDEEQAMMEAGETEEVETPEVVEETEGGLVDDTETEAAPTLLEVTAPEVDAPVEPTELEKVQGHLDNVNKALRESRDENRDIKAGFEEVKGNFEKKFDEFKASLVPTVEVPDPEDDPLGYSQHLIKEQGKKIDGLVEGNETRVKVEGEREEEARQNAEYNTLVSMVDIKEAAFVKINPDYNDAVEFMRDIRKAELADFGVTDPQQIANDLAHQAINVSKTALSQGKDPAELMYNMAKRYGYVVKTNDGGAATLETVKKGQAANTTLSGGGAQPDTTPTVSAILNAEGEEFEKLWEQAEKDMQ